LKVRIHGRNDGFYHYASPKEGIERRFKPSLDDKVITSPKEGIERLNHPTSSATDKTTSPKEGIERLHLGSV